MEDIFQFDILGIFDTMQEFLDTFFNDVLNAEMTGLIMYLFGCFPAFLRSYAFFIVMLAILLALWFFFRKVD